MWIQVNAYNNRINDSFCVVVHVKNTFHTNVHFIKCAEKKQVAPEMIIIVHILIFYMTFLLLLLISFYDWRIDKLIVFVNQFSFDDIVIVYTTILQHIEMNINNNINSFLSDCRILFIYLSNNWFLLVLLVINRLWLYRTSFSFVFDK